MLFGGRIEKCVPMAVRVCLLVAKPESKACEKFRKRMPFVDAFLMHLPTLSECKAVIARRLGESVRWVSLPLLKDFQRFQRGCQCYLFLIVVCGACQLPESEADDLLCGANLTFQQLRTI